MKPSYSSNEMLEVNNFPFSEFLVETVFLNVLNNSLHSCVSQLTAEDAFKLEDRVEASMIQLQADLHEAKSRNIYLNDLVEEQKRQAVTTY